METDIQRVKRVKDKYVQDLMKNKDVQIVSVGYKETGGKVTDKVAIRIGVTKKLPKAQLKKKDLIKKTIGGVETDIFESDKIMAPGDLDIATTPRKRKWRPAFPGLSLGHYMISAGTLGCLVKDVITKELLILSNNHVVANSNAAKIGDPIYQPGPHEGGKVNDTLARLFRFKVIEFGSDKFNLIDAGVCKPVDDALVVSKIADLDTPTSPKEATLGMKVIKSGRTTGVTKGMITDLHATIRVGYGDGKVAIFQDQLLSTNMSKGGDSGSLLMQQGTLAAVGLLFAGSSCVTVFNRIEVVLRELGVELVVRGDEPPVPPVPPKPPLLERIITWIIKFFQSLFKTVDGK